MRRLFAFALLAGLVWPVTTLTAVTRAATPSQSCSWGAKSDPDTVNVAYPDTSASYWSYQYKAVPGTELVVHGQYPKARYFSFHVYQPSAVPIDSIYDAQITPDKGSANPFTGPAAGRRQDYAVTVLFAAKPAHPAANTLYAGQTQIDGAPNPGGTLMLRVYVPTDPGSPSGGVPLPTVTWQTTSGQVLTSGADCSNDLPSTNGAITQTLNGQSPAEAPTVAKGAPLSWSKAKSSPYVGAYGNQQNAYLTASINRADGDLIVIHGKAPTFPNTTAGEPVYGNYQLRYWSFCENSTDTRVIACAPDYESNARYGSYTYVISDPSTRPGNATAANGVAWIPWGPTDATAVIIFRNMLPADSFTHAVQNIPSSGGNPAQVMGAYFPAAAYCTTAVFEQGGWRACFKAAGM